MITVITKLFFLLILLLAAVIDIKYYRIPNPLSLGGSILLFTLQWIDSVQFPKAFLFSSLISFGIMLLFILLTKGKLGMGDAKLSLLTGGVLGLYYWLISLFIASSIALLVILPVLKYKKKGRKTPIPFAPFLALGALAALFLKKEGYFVP